MNYGPFIVGIVLAISLALILIAAMMPKVRQYKLRSPIHKVQPKKKRKLAPKKKKLPFIQISVNKR